MDRLRNKGLHVVSICWHCSGTGRRLASSSPISFRVCPVCNGFRGRCEPTHVLMPVFHGTSTSRAEKQFHARTPA
ncbi:hypothetical protein LAZ40_11195 [Cereibacter sphaeroides]|uniref:hypothetical protein n=1 Tax=Cereibacter sphaeroides TaxID=1063 RepID=UPI001F48257A|nr:hypothetical protein [Cereibacter sphaeroides]MCE6959616.1 hypothetical protein [Cereibacter sphaeroides]MCE6974524.1 hypothetical protein [Cereibacter sphaeroides]